MEAVLSGLLVAGLTGLTILAYKHPAAYAKLYIPLLVLVLIAVSSLGAWNLAVITMWAKLDQMIDPSKGIVVLEARRQLEVSFTWIFIGMAGCLIYFGFLRFLPNLLGKEDSISEASEVKPQSRRRKKEDSNKA